MKRTFLSFNSKQGSSGTQHKVCSLGHQEHLVPLNKWLGLRFTVFWEWIYD